MCIVEFGRKFGMPASMSFNYLKEHKALAFLDECYAAEHTLSLMMLLKIYKPLAEDTEELSDETIPWY